MDPMNMSQARPTKPSASVPETRMRRGRGMTLSGCAIIVLYLFLMTLTPTADPNNESMGPWAILALIMLFVAPIVAIFFTLGFFFSLRALRADKQLWTLGNGLVLAVSGAGTLAVGGLILGILLSLVS